MTYEEAMTWAKYRNKRGSLNISLRIEEGFAYVQALIFNALAKDKVSPEKFMPHVVIQGEEKPTDIASVFNMLKAVAATNKPRE